MTDPYKHAAHDLIWVLGVVAAVVCVLFLYVGGLVWLLGKWWAFGLSFGPLIGAFLVLAFFAIADDYKQKAHR